jgi:hypothetical protein
MDKCEFTSQTAGHATEVRELTAGELESVAGGRKSGEGQKDFLVITMKEVFVS